MPFLAGIEHIDMLDPWDAVPVGVVRARLVFHGLVDPNLLRGIVTWIVRHIDAEAVSVSRAREEFHGLVDPDVLRGTVE